MARLHELPNELIHYILLHVQKADVKSFNRVSRTCNSVATLLLWNEVELTDCHTTWPGSTENSGTESGGIEEQPASTSDPEGWSNDRETQEDDHDDTRIIAKLLVIISNEHIASAVQTLTHRCHRRPPPASWALRLFNFAAQTLSTDPRTIEAVKLAVARMKNVHTLRIILGHPTLTDALLRCFFDARRKVTDCRPVSKLWLESCRINGGLDHDLAGMQHPYGLPPVLNFEGLQSIRFRQMPMHPGMTWDDDDFDRTNFKVFSRDARYKVHYDYLDVPASITTSSDELFLNRMHPASQGVLGIATAKDSLDLPNELYENVHRWDDMTFERLGSRFELPVQVARAYVEKPERAHMAYRGSWLDPLEIETCLASRCLKDAQRERKPATIVAISMLKGSFSSLTSITLDWILSPFDPYTQNLSFSLEGASDLMKRWSLMYRDFFDCRFPKLRALQFRNMTTANTDLPTGLFLLEASQIPLPYDADNERPLSGSEFVRPRTIEFMEAHPGLECLSWPMDRFFREHNSLKADPRVEAIVENLGRNLVDLRVDSIYGPYAYGMGQSEEVFCYDKTARSQRRLFIESFAAKMSQLGSIKLEGRIPRDERRETIRALHACPLTKVVFIAPEAQIGNTWGADSVDVNPIVRIDGIDKLEGEDKAGIHVIISKAPAPIKAGFQFQSEYGPSAEPMLYTIARFHASTVKEIKLCGFLGAPLLFNPGPTPITHDLLSALKNFHKLETLVLAFWLTTLFEDDLHDDEVLAYWENSSSPLSTALMRISNEEPQGWERELKNKYAPPALAWHVMKVIGPHLSEDAKRRVDGVTVRASFSIGEHDSGASVDIKDLDVRIGKDAFGHHDVCLGFEGPRDEHEYHRRKAKLDERGWF